jgi:hypothetical protein
MRHTTTNTTQAKHLPPQQTSDHVFHHRFITQKRTGEQAGLMTSSLPPKHRKLDTAPPFANRESHSTSHANESLTNVFEVHKVDNNHLLITMVIKHIVASCEFQSSLNFRQSSPC